ncbi:hypothetical protein [Nonomuraea sp. NPDC048916]|uniref:hypothetical protein n=1 Tax=Nonomuraea sp. NPDC048916 TaxID=3154232 RepID=UPI003409ADD7
MAERQAGVPVDGHHLAGAAGCGGQFDAVRTVPVAVDPGGGQRHAVFLKGVLDG